MLVVGLKGFFNLLLVAFLDNGKRSRLQLAPFQAVGRTLNGIVDDVSIGGRSAVKRKLVLDPRENHWRMAFTQHLDQSVIDLPEKMSQMFALILAIGGGAEHHPFGTTR